MLELPPAGTLGVINGDEQEYNWESKLVSWAIRFGTDSWASHAFVYRGDNQIVEAVLSVKISPVTKYQNIRWLTNLPSGATVASAATGFVGQRYNLVDIGVIALAQPRLGHLIQNDDWIARRLSDDHMQICSQLCVNSERLAGHDLFPGQLSGLISPGNLLTLDEEIARGV